MVYAIDKFDGSLVFYAVELGKNSNDKSIIYFITNNHQSTNRFVRTCFVTLRFFRRFRDI